MLPDGRTVVVAVKETPFLHLYDAHKLQVAPRPAALSLPLLQSAGQFGGFHFGNQSLPHMHRSLFVLWYCAGSWEGQHERQGAPLLLRIPQPQLLWIYDTPVCHLTTLACQLYGIICAAQEWDDTLSFAATTVAVSPCGNFLLVSTDGPRIMVFRIRGAATALMNLTCRSLAINCLNQ